MWAINCGILSEEQKAMGFSLAEDEDFLYLLHQGKVIATFNATRVNPLEIHREIVCRGGYAEAIEG